MQFLILFCTFIAAFTAIVFFYSLMRRDYTIIKLRLNGIGMSKNSSVEEDELSKPFHSRIIQPVIKEFSGFVSRIAPKEIVAGYENMIIAAGVPYNFGVNEWLMIQAFLVIAVPVVSAVIGISLKADSLRIISIVALEILFGIIAPKLVLSSKTQQRRKEIMKTLPGILDLITVSVEAGLGFDAALGVVVEKMQGVLSREFERVIQEMKVGKSRKDALKNMSVRIGMVDFTTFTASIIQADQLGVSIGKVLRIQSQQMRMKRRQQVQEKAMKAPIKMLIPMVLFIFPTIFTVILGPMVITLIETFKK